MSSRCVCTQVHLHHFISMGVWDRVCKQGRAKVSVDFSSVASSFLQTCCAPYAAGLRDFTAACKIPMCCKGGAMRTEGDHSINLLLRSFQTIE